MDFYVYLHRKKTDGTVFYVGKGCNDRMYSYKSRSKFWHNIVNKDGFYVDVVEKGLQEWYAHELEVSLILKYGRRDINTGSLVNLTDGGDGFSGLVYTKDMRQAISKRVAGEGHPSYNNKEFTFINYLTGKTVVTTRLKFLRDHPQIRGSEVVVSGENTGAIFKGWYIKEFMSEDKLEAAVNGYKGKYNWNTDSSVYKFVNVNTGQVYVGTREELNTKFGTNCSPLFSGSMVAKGWTTQEHIDKYGIERVANINTGLYNGRADKTLYTFYNTITKEIMVSTKYELSKLLETSVSKLTTVPNSVVKDWCLFDYKDTFKSKDCKIIYEFLHVDGQRFRGTRLQFKNSTGVNSKPLFGKNPLKTSKGWSLVE